MISQFEIACLRHWRKGKSTYEIARHLSAGNWPNSFRQEDGWIPESAVYNALHNAARCEVSHAA